MPLICAIFTHFASRNNTLTCLSRLAAQTHRPQHVVIINNGSAEDPTLPDARELALKAMPEVDLHILQMPANLGNAGGCAAGMNYAYDKLGADFVWILDDDSWPRPDAMQALLSQAADNDTIRMSLVIDPSKDDELSWPLTVALPAGRDKTWEHISERKALPQGDCIPSRGGWLGALYPRTVWQRIGTPTPELFIRGEDEEYPWKARHAGFRFITVRTSELEHPSSRCELIHYQIADRSYFYEPGLHPSRMYYKVRNWAWLQRLKHPKAYLHRLVACGFYILFSLNAILRSDEVSLLRIYTLFRALHNGFYGKLRPY